MSSDPCGTVTIVDPCGVTVVPPGICGTVAPVKFAMRVSATRFSTVVTDRSIALPGETFLVYLLADADEYLVTDTGLFIIAG